MTTGIRAAWSAPFQTSKWITVRFERGTRYYRLHLEQDLWGAWCLTRVNGRRNTRLGRALTTWPGTYGEALARLSASAVRRREGDYQFVPVR
jgi:hypothetical protein